MSRLVALIALILVVLLGATFFFAGRATERPTTQVEKAVDLANLS